MSIQVLAADGRVVRYTDRKRWLWALSIVWPLMPVASCLIAAYSGKVAWYWLTFVVWYGVIPILDHLLAADSSNPPPEVVEPLEQDRYYRLLTYLTVPIHYLTMIYAAYVVGTQALPWHAILGLALSVGIINGLAINTGHELGHKTTTTERWLAKGVLAVVGYGHFFIEHNRGHHKDVATPEDPASSRMGETIYTFVLREVPGAIRRAWSSERTRLARSGKSPWSPGNEVLQPLLITVPLYAGLILAFGWVMLPFLFIQGFWGWWILTSANYIEHYGLLRQRRLDASGKDSGRYEHCQPRHSWNSNHVMSNLILFHLQRHSDHHANPTRRYQSLRNFEQLPELPSGYPLMFGIALFPPLWFAIMNPRVVAWADGDLGKINMLDSKRAGLVSRYGGAAKRVAPSLT